MSGFRKTFVFVLIALLSLGAALVLLLLAHSPFPWERSTGSATSSNTNLSARSAWLEAREKEADNSVDFYIFNIDPVDGFVIVTAHDNMEPVIGYSTESDFRLNGIENIGISDWMNTAAETGREYIADSWASTALLLEANRRTRPVFETP